MLIFLHVEKRLGPQTILLVKRDAEIPADRDGSAEKKRLRIIERGFW
jgi:hypothetical protein